MDNLYSRSIITPKHPLTSRLSLEAEILFTTFRCLTWKRLIPILLFPGTCGTMPRQPQRFLHRIPPFTEGGRLILSLLFTGIYWKRIHCGTRNIILPIRTIPIISCRDTQDRNGQTIGLNLIFSGSKELSGLYIIQTVLKPTSHSATYLSRLFLHIPSVVTAAEKTSTLFPLR